MKPFRFIFIVLMSLSGVSGVIFSASADVIDQMRNRIPEIVQLKEAGCIGEQLDGRLGLVSGCPQGVKCPPPSACGNANAIISAENKDRDEIDHQRFNKEKHGSFEHYTRALGEARIQNEPAGRAVQDAARQWKAVKKGS